MRKQATWPVALTIAGSDSGGGAGIQADLKTFASLGVHGTSAITCLTAQNPKAVTAVQPVTAKMVGKQIEALLAELPPQAVKTGMLFSREIICVVAALLGSRASTPLVVDPVMASTSGAPLLKRSALKALQAELLPRATLLTPNLDEAQLLLKRRITEPEHLREAAREVHERWGCAALIKGGHLRGTREAIDIFYDGKTEWLLSAPYIKGVSTHGTGCTYSAAVAGYLALGCALSAAVPMAKRYITQAIAQSGRAAGHSVLNCFRGFPSRNAAVR